MSRFLKVITVMVICESVAYAKIKTDIFDRGEWTKARPLQTLWTVDIFGHLTQCAVQCAKDFKCWSYQFNPLTRVCTGHAGILRIPSLQGVQVQPGSVFYSLKRELGSLQSPCKTNTECRVHKSVCHKGQCLCKPGYSFIYSRKKCVRRCKKYGTAMTPYAGLAILGHLAKFNAKLTFFECIKACIREKTFVCRTIDLVNGKRCSLHKVSYLDVMKIFRTSGRNWMLLARNCEN